MPSIRACSLNEEVRMYFLFMSVTLPTDKCKGGGLLRKIKIK